MSTGNEKNTNPSVFEPGGGVPATACLLAGGFAEVGDNGNEAKSAPIRLLARSSNYIEHPYWGRVIHDLSGMTLHKTRLPIDYCHDTGQVIGYLSHFEVKPEGLVASGALTPWKDDDRAAEVIAKMRLGVPYEASINFGGDGIEIELVPEGERLLVNGLVFEGPGVVIRKWPLRGVAICPYGADARTDASEILSRQFSVRSLTLVKTQNTNTKGEEMNKDQKTVDATAEAEAAKLAAVEANPPVVAEGVAAAELEQSVADGAADAVAVEDTQDEAETVRDDTAETADDDNRQISVTELQRIADEFGAETAMQVVLNGGDYEAARELHYEAVKAELADLKKAAEKAETVVGEVTPAKFAAVDDATDGKAKMKAEFERKGLTSGQAAFAADCKKAMSKNNKK